MTEHHADFIFDQGTFDIPAFLLEDPELLEMVQQKFETISKVSQRLKLSRILTRLVHGDKTFKILVINKE